MNSYLQSADIFKIINQSRKPLIIVGVIAAIASAIFSGPDFIKPRYKSESVMYPSNLTKYSDESPTEQMIQLLQSSDIRDSVINAFSLYQHYEIDSVKNKTHRTEIFKMYDQNVSISKTEYESVNIVVYDTDPIYAAGIIDSMVSYLNKKARFMQREKSYEVLAMSRQRLSLKKMEMDSIEALIQTYRDKYGLLEYKTQAKEYARAYLKAIQSGSPRALAESKQMLTSLGEKGGEFSALSEHLWRVRGAFNDLKQEYETYLNDVSKVLTYANIVTYPVPADKKSYPIRWLIVVISVSSSLFMAFLVLLFLDSKKMKAPIH
ncbi:MAG: hypothetical protein NTV09_01790 [Bacteroidetes bacterium]|nr:hypothetical protein [Bacteroidota bacterium]